MSRIYFIGGAPRSGKTTLLQRVIKKKPMLAASTDAIRAAARSATTSDLNPKLFNHGRGKFDSTESVQNMLHNPSKILQFHINEAEETWMATSEFVKYYAKDGKDAAIEGVAVLPKELVKLKIDYKAIFIVNLEDQTEAILKHAQTNSYDWLSKYTDDTIRAFCHFNQCCNKYYADEAAKYGFKVIEVNSHNFDRGIEEAAQILLS